MRRRIDPELTARARELRNNPTQTELVVWHLISRYRPAFTRQLVEAPFIIDLACRQARLAIEFDGSQHIFDAERDARRTDYLHSKGWRVLRFWNSEVLTNPEGAVQHILEQVRVPRRHPPPAPPFQGGEDSASTLEPLTTPAISRASP